MNADFPRRSRRWLLQTFVVALSLLTIAASGEDCDGARPRPILESLRYFHHAIVDLEEAVCGLYDRTDAAIPSFCESASPPCELEPDAGDCRAVIPRWAFDAEAGECVLFNWGGCGGNANNFVSRAACQGECRPCDIECLPHQRCLRSEQCDDFDGCESYCADTCRGVECGDGQRCQLTQVQCIRSPCPPVAMCVDVPDPCLDSSCRCIELPSDELGECTATLCETDVGYDLAITRDEPFARASLFWVLRVGDRSFHRSRFGEAGDPHTLVYPLSDRSIARLEDGDAISIGYGSRARRTDRLSDGSRERTRCGFFEQP